MTTLPLGRRLAVACVVLIALTALASAQTPPTTLNYQGRLTDNTAQMSPFNGTASMRFRIWDAESGGTQLWQEPASGGIPVSAVDGIFSVMLGSDVPLPASVFTGATSTRYLEVTIDPDLASEETLTPREPIGSVAYAQLAAEASSAATADQADDASALGGTAPSGWQRALGTSSCPGGQFYSSISQAGSATCAPPTFTESDPQIGTLSTDRVPKWNGTELVDSAITVDGSGNVGVGTTIPSMKLDVNGRVRIRGGSPSNGKVLTATDGNGNSTWETPTVSGVTAYSASEAFIDAGATNVYTDATGTGVEPQVQGPGSFLVLASWRYKIEGGSGTDDFQWRFNAVPTGGCGASVASSESGVMEDDHRGQYHATTFHSTLDLTETCNYQIRLQYGTGLADDDLYYDNLKITALRTGN